MDYNCQFSIFIFITKLVLQNKILKSVDVQTCVINQTTINDENIVIETSFL